MDIDLALKIIDENLDFDLRPMLEELTNAASGAGGRSSICPAVEAADHTWMHLENCVGDHIEDEEGAELLCKLNDSVGHRLGIWNDYQYACGILIGLMLAGVSVDAIKALAHKLKLGTMKLAEAGDS
ncbi:MAG TPA: hypothetical protein VGK77_18295 [Candidatus Binatia bacterium]